jgi:hypothetical protein
MPYTKPDVFVNVTVAEPAPTPVTPTLFPTMVAPHFFVAYKEQVTDAGKDYFDGLPLNSIAYPLLPKQSITTADDLLVDVGDLSPAANDAVGSPNIERFDPDVYIITDAGAEIDISLAELLFIRADNFDIPGNMTYDIVNGTYLTTKGDIVDGDMADSGVADWTTIETTNAPVLSKDAGEKDYANDYALKITLDAVPTIGDGVTSTAFTVIPGETYKAIIRAKKDDVTGVNFDLEVWDDDNVAQITGDVAHENEANTEYATFEIVFTVPATCSTISLQGHAAAATANGIFYLGSAHVLYTGADALAGEILVSYRALEEKYSGARLQKLEASTVAELTALFGTAGVGPSNPLGFMMYNGIRHANMTVRGIAVGNPADGGGASTYTGSLTSETLAYSASKDFMNTDPDAFYAITISTYNEAIWDEFLAYVNSLSASSKHWARLIVGTQVDTQSIFRIGADGLLYGKFSSATIGGFTDQDVIAYSGNDYTLRVINGVAYAALPLASDTSSINFDYESSPYTDGDFVIEDAGGVKLGLTSVLGGNFVSAGYKKVKINDTALIGSTEYTVLEVRSDFILMELTSGADVAGGANKAYSVFRYLTADGTSTGIPAKTLMAEMLRDKGNAYADERLVITMPGWLSDTINSQVTDVEIWYLNAQLAAEMCLPVNPDLGQGPGYPVGLGFTGLKDAKTNDFRSVRYFTEAQLDIIGSGGISIVENQNVDLVLSLRHALTTRMSAIEYQEIMLGVARDYVSYSCKDTMNGLVKRTRIAQPLGTALKLRLEGLKAVLVGTEQVIRSMKITDIRSGDTVDSVTMSGTITHFYPLNRLDVNLEVVEPVPFTVSL